MSRIIGMAALVAAALGALAPLEVGAQLSQPVSVQRPALQLGLGRPIFVEDEFGAASGVLTLRGSVPVRRLGTLFVEGALAHATIEQQLSPGLSAAESSTTLSNTRVGIVIGTDERFRGLASVTLPTVHEWGADNFATGMGISSDLERMEAYLEDGVALEGGITVTRRGATGAAVGARLAGVAITRLDSSSDSDMEGVARYGAHVDFPGSAVRVRAELSGVAILTEEGSLAERSFHYLSVSAALAQLGMAPELYVRIPIDSEVQEWMRGSAGIRVRF